MGSIQAMDAATRSVSFILDTLRAIVNEDEFSGWLDGQSNAIRQAMRKETIPDRARAEMDAIETPEAKMIRFANETGIPEPWRLDNDGLTIAAGVARRALEFWSKADDRAHRMAKQIIEAGQKTAAAKVAQRLSDLAAKNMQLHRDQWKAFALRETSWRPANFADIERDDVTKTAPLRCAVFSDDGRDVALWETDSGAFHVAFRVETVTIGDTDLYRIESQDAESGDWIPRTGLYRNREALGSWAKSSDESAARMSRPIFENQSAVSADVAEKSPPPWGSIEHSAQAAEKRSRRSFTEDLKVGATEAEINRQITQLAETMTHREFGIFGARVMERLTKEIRARMESAS